jgi:hypothetical protein
MSPLSRCVFRLSLAPGALLSVACGSSDLVLPDQTEPARIEAVSGTNQAGAVGTMLQEPLVVRVTDVQSRPVAGRKVAFVLGAGADGGNVDPDTSLTDSDGRATVRWVLGLTQGMQHVEARVVASTTLNAAFAASASVGVAARIEPVRGDGQTATAGSELPDSLVVRTLDALSRPVGGIPVAWTVTGGGAVSAATTVSGPDGMTGVRRTLGAEAGAQSTEATVENVSGSPVSFTATASVGEAGRLVVLVQPPLTSQSGLPFSRQPQVQLVDANGNEVARQGLAVTASVSLGPAGATLVGSRTASTNGQGLAVFGDLGISGGPGTYRLNFAGTAVEGATSDPIVLSAGAAAALRLATQPSASAAPGVPFGTQPVIQIVDAVGNVVAKPGVSVTVAIASGGGALGGTLTIVTDNAGIARFTDLSITGVPGARTLIFAADGLASVTSDPVDVRAEVDAARSTIAAPTTVGAGQSAAVLVTLRDVNGNPIPDLTVTLSATGSGNTISPASVTISGSGTAAFTFSSTQVGERELSASAGSAVIGPAPIEVVAGPPAAAQTTADVPAGRRFRETRIDVQSRDAFGNVVTVGGANVTARVSDGPNGGIGMTVTDRGDGTYLVTYFPLFSGDDTIVIELDGAPISGSPFTSHVRN